MLVAVVILVAAGISISYVAVLLTQEEPRPRITPTFIDFDLDQEGTVISIQNTGARNISAGSLKIYFAGTLLDITNKKNIRPAEEYAIKVSDLPPFEGKRNITVVLDNIDRSLEVTAIKEVSKPLSQIYPPIQQGTSGTTAATVNITSLDVRISGGGVVTLLPDGYEYEMGTEVEVNATPDKNHTFGSWILNGVEIYNSSLIIKMDKNHSLRAVFLIRSDVDCIRSHPAITIANKTVRNNVSMTFLVTVTNRDYKCNIESFELSHSCSSYFNCNLIDKLISIDSGNSSATADFLMSTKNVSSTAAGNYSFSIYVKNRANTAFTASNSSFYEIK